MQQADVAADRVWDLVTAFFEARRLFLGQYEAYESTVLGLASARGVDRSELRLPAREVSKLLDFERLDLLHERRLTPLIELSREVLYNAGTHVFHRLVVDIFHEIAILREEHVEVVEYGEQDADDEDESEREVRQVLAEVHEYFPKRMHRVHKLFSKAQGRLESLVGKYADNKVFVRSLCLFGATTWPDPGERETFYRCVYPGGIAEGMLAACDSFAAGGFDELAAGALRQATEQLDAGYPLDADLRQRLRERAVGLEARLSGARA